ncbi:uncharacterized protein BT62DRAFT_930269 [Guyanagaster necrorhizus]|uniref:F-box domain-containing protein n=1 Tax=Guyanagaster necrorhizus TaxID=856835 RepID=A0A9P8AU68_9AGAR|nr:uncharacterized protein BT62DRAFT_930269 [Guyanagaster necrorhizus MCA 3950]KAG7448174.1 hypothetical protein BT62DRAFT_930269 [Guyanagaster necrorhizus MCA 3950]
MNIHSVVMLSSYSRISALQRCPQEIWEHIIYCLDDESAASAARVCYAWTFASRRRLYRYLTFTYPSHKLEETLSNSAVIRACIRRLRLKWHAEANFDWVTLLPPGNIQSIEFYFYPGCFEETFPFHVMDNFSALAGARHITIQGPDGYGHSTLQRLCSSPVLKELQIYSSSKCNLESIDPVCPLTRLTINSCTSSFVFRFPIGSFTASLTRLDVAFDNFDRDDEINGRSRSLHDFKTSLSQLTLLQHLVVYALRHIPEPFLDEVVAHLSMLESLHATSGSYSTMLFDHLPLTLRCLSLKGFWQEATLPMVNLIHSSRLDDILLWPSRLPSRCSMDNLQPIKEACAARNVRFRVIAARDASAFIANFPHDNERIENQTLVYRW